MSTHLQSRASGWSPAYVSWNSMMQRCTNPKRNVWYLYGGKGIRICERWKTFTNFFADMGDRPEGTSLGRIDSDGDYCPENCEWQDDATQGRNKVNSKLTMHKAAAIRMRYASAEKTIVEIAKEFGVSDITVKCVVYLKTWVPWTRIRKRSKRKGTP